MTIIFFILVIYKKFKIIHIDFEIVTIKPFVLPMNLNTMYMCIKLSFTYLTITLLFLKQTNKAN